MATIGLSNLYYASITEDAAGNETYGTPAQLAKAITADITIDADEAILYADDGADAIIREFQKGTINLETNNLDVTALVALVGATKDTKGVTMHRGEDTPAPVAIGFKAKTSKGGYKYYWLYRVVFKVPDSSLKTKGESIEFATPTIEGTFTRRNKVDTQSKHPYMACIDSDESGADAATISAWFSAVYEPAYV